MFYIEKPPPEVSSFIPARFTLVPLPSCQPRLAQHHRLLLLSIPSVFSVLLSFFFLPSFSDTPRGTSSFYTRFIFFLLRPQTRVFRLSCFSRRAASAGRGKTSIHDDEEEAGCEYSNAHFDTYCISSLSYLFYVCSFLLTRSLRPALPLFAASSIFE